MRIHAPQLDGQGVYQIHAMHAPGEIAPTFTVSVRPPGGTLTETGTHLTWTPPASVTFTIGEASWTCRPGEAPKQFGEGITYQVTYLPTPLYVLRHGSYGKRLIWLSCPQWQYDIYMSTIDDEDTIVHYHDADVYTATGWTVGEIFEKVGHYAGYTIQSKIPALHVPMPTVILDPDQQFLDFLQSLLPQGFDYTWDWQGNTVVVSLADPHQTAFTIPPGATVLDMHDPGTVDYDTISITGAPYKINSGILLDESKYARYVRVNPGSSAFQEIEEALPDETHEFEDGAQTTHRWRTVKMGPDGNLFAVVTETQEVSGPIYSSSGTYTSTGVVKRIVTTNTYELYDPVVYQEPRLIESVTVSSGYVTLLSPTTVATSFGTLYYLMDDLRVVTRAEYLAIGGTTPDVLVSGSTGWIDDYETVTEQKTFVTTDTASLLWPEGIEQHSSQRVQRRTYSIAGRIFDCTESPETILQQIAQRLQTDTTPSVSSTPAAMRTVEYTSAHVNAIAPGNYTFEETRQRINRSSGRTEHEPRRTQINSTPPSQPVAYRVEPLEATLGEGGQAKVIYSAQSTIPTANPADFELWAGKRYQDMIAPHEVMTFQTMHYVLPQGYRIGGGTVIGWTATQQGMAFSAEMTVI